MTTFCQAYHCVKTHLSSCLQASKPQIVNVSLLTFGVFSAGNCQLPRVAATLPVAAGVASATQRLERLLKNRAIEPATMYASVARVMLSRFTGGRVRLIMDATQVNGRLHLLFVALAYRGRALPLGWLMLTKGSVSSSFAEQKKLLDRVAQCLPNNAEVVLLGDREYGSVALIRYCLKRKWRFCLRAKKSRAILCTDGRKMSLRSLALAPGQRLYVTGSSLPEIPEAKLQIACGWSTEDKDDEPWYILTDLPADHQVLALYARRFCIEEMFRDFKEYGFRLETTRIKDPERFSRLLLGVCLAYVWLLNAGIWVSKNGLRKLVDRRAVRQLSYFQIGWRYLRHAMIKAQPIRCQLIAYS